MDLLPDLLFDTSGGAVGDGSIEAPPQIAERFPSLRERTLALLLSRDPRLQGGHIGIAGERIAPGIHAGAQRFRIHVERPIGAFLRQYLGTLSSEAVSLRIACDVADSAPGWFSTKENGADLAQKILEMSVSVAPDENGRRVTITAHRFGPAMFKPQPPEALARDGDPLQATILINWSNLHAVFGAFSKHSEQFPRRNFDRSDRTSLDALNGRHALVGSRTALSEEWGTSTGVCGWGRDHVYQLWRGWGAPLEPRICSYGRRADGLVEPDNPYVGLVIPITLVRVRHLLNGTTHAKIHLASRCGNIGHCVDVPGPASVDYGSRRRNIEELSGELTLTREGLRMALEVRVGDYLPETVRGDGTAEPGRRTFNLDYVVSWESLFLAGLGFDYHRRRE